jgi:signal transduction histidine kinase
VTGFAQKLIDTGTRSFAWRLVQGALFWKYTVLFIAMMSLALLTDNVVGIWFTFRLHQSSLIEIQREQAESAAAKITHFIEEIQSQLGWTTYLLGATPTAAQREFDGLRLLRQAPPVAELTVIDHTGRELLSLSRQAMNHIDRHADFSSDERFKAAVALKVYSGPVYFRRGTEPFMTVAVSDARPNAGVSMADVNLTSIWDVVRQIRVGRNGRAYVVDEQGRLIAHPDISLVLRNTDLSQLPQVRSAGEKAQASDGKVTHAAFDLYGEPVLTAHAAVPGLNWLVFVELPASEANEALYAALMRTGIIVLAGLILAVLAALFLAHRMVTPIRALSTGAALIGAGALGHRIHIDTRDELEALGNQFNDMAEKLQGSYATLERKVDERTHQLKAANLAKSRFLASASHDLRQPLHALNLFVAQLRLEAREAEKERLAEQIETAVSNMNELFSALLDISKLDSGALSATIADIPISGIFARIEATFATAAQAKKLRFRVVPSSLWIRSDPLLLERVLLNLVSNAIRYTRRGGVVVGCRRAGGLVRIDVCDSGIGIPRDQQDKIFHEFYRGADADKDDGNGLGLGLAIVDRLCALLENPLGFASVPGKGSRFSVSVPIVEATVERFRLPQVATPALDPLAGKVIVVIDDDPLVLAGTSNLLRAWGCRVVAAESLSEALTSFGRNSPDLIISDFHLDQGLSGMDAIKGIREAVDADVPAFLVTGDILPDRLHEARIAGFHLLHKPVSPMALRAMISRLLLAARGKDSEGAAITVGESAG